MRLPRIRTIPTPNYREEHLYAFFEKTKLENTPGEKAKYSNLGFGLLGHALSKHAKIPYERLVKETICEPLGMSDTVITLDASQKERLAPGHNKRGEVVSNWDFDVIAPAGAFKSTVNDMLTFLAANLNTNDTALSRALQKSHQRQFEHWTGDCGLGWQIMRTGVGLNIRWHNGGTGDYSSFMGFDRQNQTAVIVLSSTGDAMVNDNSVDKMGLEILKLAAKISL